ncbi:MAG: glycosyltransferase [Candidatus Cloacimonadales bacterium]|nr:glycosyltransferase [Candidatus Cloacimonadales bacterium]
MIWQIIQIASVVALLIYLYFLRIFFLGMKHGQDLITFSKPRVSIIVAARNEEKNISRILTALVNQNYSSQNFEIIIANDGSTDETANIVNKFSAKWQNVKLLNVTGRELVISPKKNALSQAIQASTGEIILLTDADCLVGKYWIEAMLANFEEADMVVGFSRTLVNDWKKAKSAQKYEHFDFVAMFLAAGGAIASGKYFSCSGQNLAYKKSAFEKVGGFSKIEHLISGDDLNLLQLFRKNSLKVRFAFSPHSYVYTHSIENWQKLFSQRSRWASNMKWQIGLNPEFFIYLVSAYLVVLLPIALLFFNWHLALAILLIRAFSEYAFLNLGYKKLNLEKNKLNFYLPWFILQPVYFVIVSIMGALDIFSWKK